MRSWTYQAAAQAEVARVCTPKEYLAIAAQCEWKETVLDISEEAALAAAQKAGLVLARQPDVPTEYLCVTRIARVKSGRNTSSRTSGGARMLLQAARPAQAGAELRWR